jgi:hypothetical protein
LEFRIDYRRAQHFDSLDPSQYFRRLEVEIDILTVGPDAPLAAVDCLANLKVPAEWAEPLGEFLDRRPPSFSVSNEVSVLWDHKRNIVTLAEESLGQPLLIAMVTVPRVETDQDGTNAQGLDFPQVVVEILWVRADCETDAVDGLRVFVQGCFELTITSAHLCGRSYDNTEIAEVRRAVSEANCKFFAAAGVLMGLIREMVPHSLVT